MIGGRKSTLREMVCPLLLATTLAVVTPCHGQDSAVVTDGFRMTEGPTTRKYIAAGLAGSALVGTLIGSYYEWWHRDHAPFHFLHEGWFSDYALGIDKVGHMFTGYFYFNTFRNFLLWGGYSPSTAFWWSAGMATIFSATIEFGDGFSSWGFSPEDVASNIIGIGYGILQTQTPFLRNFNLKWSYIPTGGFHWPPHITDHYDFHTYWIAVDMHNLLPGDARRYWPEFLQLSVGYSVDDHQTRREGVIGLDFNLDVFETHDDTIHLLQRTISMIHLPAPGIKFTETKEPRYYLFHLN